MTWSDVYLFCFLVGFAFSALTFLAGAVHIHLPFRLHLPVHGGHGGAGSHGGAAAKGAGGRAGSHISWFNASTMMAFLAWFGGAGYILTRASHLVALVCLALAALAGLVAGMIVYRFMLKLTRSSDSQMLDADYRMEGCVGTLSMPIREKGTGEVIFSLGGVRRCAGARSEAGELVEKGAEVVIERYEKGIAYVKRWDDFTK
jgi:membrane protein implicated in regulation of membrane protease activity